jgi:hypothetical protein
VFRVGFSDVEQPSRNPRVPDVRKPAPELTLVSAKARSGTVYGSTYCRVFKYAIKSARSALSGMHPKGMRMPTM